MRDFSNTQILTFYLILVALAEILTSYQSAESGLILHITIMLILFIHYSYLIKIKIQAIKIQYDYKKNKKQESTLLKNLIDNKKKLSSLILVFTIIPLIRIMSLVMPLSNFPQVQWFLIIGIAVYLAFIVLIIQQKIKLKECGIALPKTKHLPLELGIIVFAIPMGFAEYYILKPEPFISSITIGGIIAAIIIIFIATGLMEEIIFRGLLQKKSIETIGLWPGIIFVTSIFAVLHIGNLSIWDVLLVFFIGFMYSLVVYKTKSIIGVTISHTIVNVFLFVLLPLKII